MKEQTDPHQIDWEEDQEAKKKKMLEDIEMEKDITAVSIKKVKNFEGVKVKKEENLKDMETEKGMEEVVDAAVDSMTKIGKGAVTEEISEDTEREI